MSSFGPYQDAGKTGTDGLAKTGGMWLKMKLVRQATADLFVLHASGTPIAVPTNGLLRRDGRAHLGAGSAAECGRRFPEFAVRLGLLLRSEGLHTVHVGDRLLAFPVEVTPFELPDLSLIERSACELSNIATREGWTEVALPRPGCGHGGLEWRDVMPRLAPILDDRFLVVTKEAAQCGA